MSVETYQFALRTAPRHARMFARWAGCRRWVYNELLKKVLEPIARQRAEEKAQTGRAVTRYPSAYDLQKLLPALKTQHPWLAHPPSHTLQQAIVDLSAALLRVKDGAGFPKLKRKGRSTESFRENDPALFRVDQPNSRIKVPKLGWVRYYNSRTFEGAPKTLTLVQKGGRWFASIQVELPEPAEPPVHPHADRVVGLDRGVTVFAALSDGTKIAPVSPLKGALRALRVAQRAVARKKRGSHNRRKAVRRVQRLHRKVSDIRKDFLHRPGPEDQHVHRPEPRRGRAREARSPKPGGLRPGHRRAARHERPRQGQPQPRHPRSGLVCLRADALLQTRETGRATVARACRVYQPALLGLRPYERGQPTRAGRVLLRLVRSHRERRHECGEEHCQGRAGPGGSSERRTSAAAAASPRTRQKARSSPRWLRPQAGIPVLQGREEVNSPACHVADHHSATECEFPPPW